MKFNFNIPFYYGKSWICSFSAKKNGVVEFGFIRGNELSNSQGLFLSKGRKQVKSIEFRQFSDIPEKEILEIINEAVFLDESVAYEPKRKRKSRE